MGAPPATDEERQNAIFYDRIQAETIKKELRVHHLYEHYALSPSVKTKLVINNKPQAMNLQNTDKDAEDEEYNIKSKIQSMVPRDRYPVPITSSQMYGWDSKTLFRSLDKRFSHPRVQCDITKSYGQTFGSKK
ncbi:FAM183A and FAM183B related-domain-containing protein [Obelidium mucronatum]|nr:FAM183A and FAM183B related-domain-containing protein [Obelidium mucronatum]